MRIRELVLATLERVAASLGDNLHLVLFLGGTAEEDRGRTCGDVIYDTEDGRTETLSGVQGTGPVGTQVDRYYHLRERGNAQLRGPLKFWFGPLAVVAMALVFLVLSARQLLRR